MFKENKFYRHKDAKNIFIEVEDILETKIGFELCITYWYSVLNWKDRLNIPSDIKDVIVIKYTDVDNWQEIIVEDINL